MENENKFAELEAKLKRKIKIIIPNYKHKKEISLKEFIKNFIHLGPKTIYKKNKKHQCNPGAYRSMGDIYNLCREYYPNVKVEEVMKCLVTLTKEGGISTSYCPNIRKRVFRSAYGNLDQSWRFNIYKITDENELKESDYLNLK